MLPPPEPRRPGTSGESALSTVTALAEATVLRDGRTRAVADVDEAAEAAREGFARMSWARLGVDGETRLAERGVSVRCLLGPNNTFAFDLDAKGVDAILARAY
jgi:prolyl-tRNA synthetase